MKKSLSYAGLLVLAGVIFGAIVTGLVWMQHLYDLSVSYYLFTAAFWLGMAATVLFGIWLRRYYQQISKVWVFFSVLTALFGAYLFPKFLAPTCSEIPTVKAGCETTCEQVCIDYHEAGTGGCPEIPDLPNPEWDLGCCFDYATSCTTVCTNDPPSVTGHTECDVFGNDGWCVEGGELHMSGSDPDGDGITISGTMVGQGFTCPAGSSCVRTLYEGAGNAIFHAYDGELSSGNFSVAYKYDATPPGLTPAVTGTAGTNGWYISYVSVATGATDPASGVMMSKIRLFTGGWEDSLDFNADGIYNIEMSALDNAGNESVQQAQIMVDTVDPVYDVLVGGTPGINDWYRSDVNWQAAATDATSGMASIEVNMDAVGWTVANTAAFSAEGPHTVDFRFTDVAGNNVVTNHAFSIDKTPPTITMNTPTEGKVVSRNVTVSGIAADALSGLIEVAVSPDGGSTWHIVPWQADGSWTYDWDTTSGPNGMFALIARATDEAGNVTTDQVNVIVDNAPPTVSITESWDIWDTARGSVHSNVIPVGSIHLTVECGDQPDRTYDYNANTNTFDFKWDRRCGDGNLAPSGTYTVVLEACDIYNNCDEARGKVDIPFVAAIPPTATPMPTIEKTQVVQQWYTNPTAVPSTTPTPQAQQNLPVLPLTGNGESGDENLPSGNNQPLLPLAAAALGTSVLLAASSRREEETANAPAAADTTYVEAASLSSIAGVVKETFTGVWEDAIRISAADPRRVTTTHTGIDMDEYNRKLAGWVIASEQAYKEIAKEKEEKRQAAIQWLAEHTAATEKAVMLAKEQEKAEAMAEQKAAALDAKLARMEEQTAGRNVMAQTNAAKASYKSSIPDEPTPEGEGGFFSNLWNGFLSIFGLGSNNQAAPTQTVVPPRTATPTPPPTKTNTPTITSTPTPVIPIGVQYEKEIHNDEINALKACYADIKNVYYGITPTPKLTATATIESTLEATATPTITVSPTPIPKDIEMLTELYYDEDNKYNLFIYYTKKVINGQSVYNCEYVGVDNLKANEIKDDYEQLNTYRGGNCAAYVNTILKKTGLDLVEKYGTNEIYNNVKTSAPAMTQALVVEEKWTIEAVTKDNLVEIATTDKVGCVVAFSKENIDTTLFSENIVGTSTPPPASTGTTTPELTNTPTLIPDPKNSDSSFSQVKHVGYITDVAEGDITYADNSSSDFYDQLMDENIPMDQISNDYKSLDQRMTDKPEYSVYLICPPGE